jgi:hypothetical protein
VQVKLVERMHPVQLKLVPARPVERMRPAQLKLVRVWYARLTRLVLEMVT